MSPPAHSSWNGLLFVNKPSGPTTYDMIRWLKKKVPGIKIGHSGTLDPLASGLVILLLGNATKRQSELMKQNKTYRCTMRLGIQTDTGDQTGITIHQSTVPDLNKDEIISVFQQFLGEQWQTPPMYSALKHKGQPLYKLARKGEQVERTARSIQIHQIDLLENKLKEEIEFRTSVSSGTYVRVLVEDMGKKMGTHATLSALCREAIGENKLEKALDGNDLNTLTPDQILHHLIEIPIHA
ncbi:tRNA pseudouridine(55) synthase TruB [bacterium F11]|nr:tRNA pseudouridine(55) synthase TruB [bacterium F11]